MKSFDIEGWRKARAIIYSAFRSSDYGGKDLIEIGSVPFNRYVTHLSELVAFCQSGVACSLFGDLEGAGINFAGAKLCKDSLYAVLMKSAGLESDGSFLKFDGNSLDIIDGLGESFWAKLPQEVYNVFLKNCENNLGGIN